MTTRRPAFALIAAAALSRGVLPALAVGSSLISGGCVLNFAMEEETRTSAIPHVAAGPVVVKTANGSISLTATPDAKDVTIVAKLRAQTKERLAATKVLAERMDDKTLSVYVKWPDDTRRSGEGCSFEIVLPDAADATLDSNNGALTIDGVSGAVKATTSNGAITVEHPGGEVVAKTSNGHITITDAPGRVNADSSNGALHVALAPANKGPVNLDTSNGRIEFSFGPAFAGSLIAKTSNGGITVKGVDAANVAQPKKTRAELKLGDGEASVLDTSNGSITIERKGE